MKKVIEYLKYIDWPVTIFWGGFILVSLVMTIGMIMELTDSDYRSRKIHDGDLMITMQGDTVEIHHYKHTLYYTKVSK